MIVYFVRAGIIREMQRYYTHPVERINAHIEKELKELKTIAVVTGFEKEIHDENISSFREIKGVRVILALRPIPWRVLSAVRDRLEAYGFWAKFDQFELPPQGAFTGAVLRRTGGLFQAYVELVSMHLMQARERRQEILRRYRAAFRRLIERVLGRLEGVLDHPSLARWARMIVRSGEKAETAVDDG